MRWKNQLRKFEQNNNWKSAVKLAEHVIKYKPNEVEIYVRIIFVLLDLLVDGRYTQEEHDYAAIKLKSYFDISYKKFLDSSEYLFFLGFFIPIAEWYFGINNIEKGYGFRRKALEKEPDNVLYKWAFNFFNSPNRLAGYFAKQLLTNTKYKVKIDWLRSKGTAGEYIIGMIEYCYKLYISPDKEML